MNPLCRLAEFGQSFWYDNIRRSLITSGELARMVSEDGLRGLTSNPTIFEKAISSSSDYDAAIAEAAGRGLDAEEVLFSLAVDDIRKAADLLRPVYEESEGADGLACLELPPALALDAARSLSAARDLFSRLGRPNVMIKIPGTPEGLPAIRSAIAEGINVNVTLLFSCATYEDVAEAYIAGLEDRLAGGADVSRVASVASFFVSRIDKICDAAFLASGHPELLGTVGIANAKDAYQRFRRIFGSDRFRVLQERGARVQRCLWASTSTKDPRLSDVLYVENLIGPDTVNTLPEVTVNAFRDHGRVRPTLTERVDEALAQLARLPELGIDLDSVTSRLQDDGVRLFAEDFDRLVASFSERLKARRAVPSSRAPAARLGPVGPLFESVLSEAAKADVGRRVWEGDATLWSDEPEHKEVITQRLGWLAVHERMEHELDALHAFAEEVRDGGITHVVLLGMGGSSLAPEVIRRCIGSREGYPELIVLDSTHPAQVEAVTAAVDLARSLFVVASKSGTTLEPNELYSFFRKRGARDFVAITDPHTDLERRATADGFRRAFLNPADIGGRYSALSYFGLVPAALMGLDLRSLLEPVADIVSASARSVPPPDNPALWLGCALGAAQRAGRDKVTLVCGEALAPFGLWAEQLLAESTGKEGTGLVPVAGEPLGQPEVYGEDRLFLALRTEGDGLDAALSGLASAGHPVVEVRVGSPKELFREFWRFEFATAVAGHVLGIDPFDEPNVAEAKAATAAILERGHLPDVPIGSVGELIDEVRAGDYFSVLAYLPYSDDVERAVSALRVAVRARTKAATTFGYGPRYLHSTGQLHKGGPNSGVFLLVTSGEDDGAFGRIALSQALGDYETLRRHGRRVARVHVRDAAEFSSLL